MKHDFLEFDEKSIHIINGGRVSNSSTTKTSKHWLITVANLGYNFAKGFVEGSQSATPEQQKVLDDYRSGNIWNN